MPLAAFVLFSSIFFMALSELSGNRMTAKWSSLGSEWIALRWYLGLRGSFKVFGRWKVVDVRIFFFWTAWVPFSAAFLAASAFFLSPAHRVSSMHTRTQQLQRIVCLGGLPDCFSVDFGGMVVDVCVLPELCPHLKFPSRSLRIVWLGLLFRSAV